MLQAGEHSAQMGTTSPRVVIVGAGVAGLVAASHLHRQGFADVVVLEAQSRIGGRIHTIAHGDGILEIGAQWIHGEVENPLCKFAMENGLINVENVLHSGEGLGHYYTQEGAVISSEIVKQVHEVMQEADENCCNFLKLVERNASCPKNAIPASVEHYFHDHFKNYLEKWDDPPHVRKLREGLYRWHLMFHCLDNACYSMREISAATWGEFQHFKGRHWVNLHSGYHDVINALVSTLPNGTILVNKPVAVIEWGDGLAKSSQFEGQVPLTSDVGSFAVQKRGTERQNVEEQCSFNDLQDLKYKYNVKRKARARVQCDDGSEFLADHVIITVSLGVLKRYHRQLFKPPLPPGKQRVIANMGFGILNKIYLVFDRPFWDKQAEGFQLVWTDGNPLQRNDDSADGDYPWYQDITGFDVIPNQSNVLLGWIGRHGAEKMEKVPEKEVGDTCVNLLKQFTGLSITTLKQVIRSSWSGNPYFCGSYSFRTVQSDTAGDHTSDLARPVYTEDDKNCPLLLFAGEATEIHHFSTVHGAFMSGKREADRLTAYYANETSHGR